MSSRDREGEVNSGFVIFVMEKKVRWSKSKHQPNLVLSDGRTRCETKGESHEKSIRRLLGWGWVYLFWNLRKFVYAKKSKTYLCKFLNTQYFKAGEFLRFSLSSEERKICNTFFAHKTFLQIFTPRIFSFLLLFWVLFSPFYFYLIYLVFLAMNLSSSTNLFSLYPYLLFSDIIF